MLATHPNQLKINPLQVTRSFPEWNPLWENDYELAFEIDPLEYIQHQVFQRNEAWDIFIRGFKGNGKSTVGLGLAMLLNPKLIKMPPTKALNRCWSFTTQERHELNQNLKRGDVHCNDEQGTGKSGSSYEWNKQENKDLADLRQLDRTDGVINIGMTIDEMRVLKRLRQLYRVEVYPADKKNNDETGDNGLGIECIIRELVENPFANNDSDRFKRKYFNYAQNGRIARIVVPHPPVEHWLEYVRRRDEFKQSLEDEIFVKEYPKSKSNSTNAQNALLANL